MQALTVCTKGYMVSFLPTTQMRVNAGTDKVIFFHHSTGKNVCLDLFSFGIGDSETNGQIFMFVAHSDAPFVLTVVA